MGLFNAFKGNKSSHEEKVQLAYHAYKQDMVEMVFPGRTQQADCIIRSIAILTTKRLSECDAKNYFEMLTIYSDVLIRCVITHSEDDMIIAMLQDKHCNYVKSAKVAHKVLTYCRMNMNNNTFALDKKEDIEALNLLSSIFASNEAVTENNDSALMQNLNDPEYGIIPIKPIYTHGVAGSKRYLSNLRTEAGEPITWKREMAICVDGVNGMVDIYSCFAPNGKLCGTLYVNIYGSQNSTTAPAGFYLVGSKPIAKPIQDVTKHNVQQANAMVEQKAEKEAENIPLEELAPQFDLQQEKKNPYFTALLECGVDALDAFEIIHKDELLLPCKSEFEGTKILTIEEAKRIIEASFSTYEEHPLKNDLEIQQLATEYGVTFDQALEIEKTAYSNAKAKRNAQRDTHEKWAVAAVGVRDMYHSFNLESEMQNAVFKQMLSREIPMIMAFEAVHKKELFTKPDKREELLQPVFCRMCGTKLLSDSVFCMKCGVKVERPGMSG